MVLTNKNNREIQSLRSVVKSLQVMGFKLEFDDFGVLRMPYGGDCYLKYSNESTINKQPRYQWRIPKECGNNESDIFIAIADTGQGFEYFIIPSKRLEGRTHIDIRSKPDKYNGWLKKYRDNWSVVSHCAQVSLT